MFKQEGWVVFMLLFQLYGILYSTCSKYSGSVNEKQSHEQVTFFPLLEDLCFCTHIFH